MIMTVGEADTQTDMGWEKQTGRQTHQWTDDTRADHGRQTRRKERGTIYTQKMISASASLANSATLPGNY